MHAADHVAIVANDGGLPAGTVLPGPVGSVGTGLTLRERVPQAHKVALVDLPAGSAVRHDLTYGPVVGTLAMATATLAQLHLLADDMRLARDAGEQALALFTQANTTACPVSPGIPGIAPGQPYQPQTPFIPHFGFFWFTDRVSPFHERNDAE